ncbi:MAG: pyridoxal phosphate-dependent aminotransferase [Candidatus Dormiibacterota bacterium]
MDNAIDLSEDRLVVASPDHVRAAAKMALERGETHYTTRPGIIPLREAIATSFSDATGISTDPLSQVLITSGEEEALFVVIHTLIASGDEVLILGPSPRSDDDVVRRAGGTVRHVSRSSPVPQQPSDSMPAISDRTRVVLVRRPSLKGDLDDDAFVELLHTQVELHNSVVVSIEVGADFYRTGYEHRPFALKRDGENRTVTIGGFGAWGLDGWRVGYMVGPRSLVAPMTAFKQALSICSPALGQYAALASVSGSQAHLHTLRSTLDSRWKAVVSALSRSAVPVRVEEAGYHLFVPWPRSGGDYTREIWQECRVRVADGADVNLPGTVRITLSQSEPLLAEAAARLARLIGGQANG